MKITVLRKVTLAIILVATVIAIGADDDETLKSSIRSHNTENEKTRQDFNKDAIDIENSDKKYDVKEEENLDNDSIIQISDELLNSDENSTKKEDDQDYNSSSSMNDIDIQSSKCQNESVASDINIHSVNSVNSVNSSIDTKDVQTNQNQTTRQSMESMKKDEANDTELSQNKMKKESFENAQQNVIHDKNSYQTDVEWTSKDDESKNQRSKVSASQTSEDIVEQINIIEEQNIVNPNLPPIESKMDKEKDLNQKENSNNNYNDVNDSLKQTSETSIQFESTDSSNPEEVIEQIQNENPVNQKNTQNKSKVEEDDDDDEDDIPMKHRVVVNYAHKSAGAVVLEKSSNFKGTSNLLTSDNDKYAISPCNDKKYVVIGLSEDILVKQIVLANFERYSSHIQNFQILGSQAYPTGNWHDLGIYTAKPGNGVQIFDLMEPSWARYLKFKFISHYGEEHFCTVSQIKVHGSTMLQGFHEQWTQSEKEKKQMLQEEEVEKAEEAKIIQTKEKDEKHEQVDTNIHSDIASETNKNSISIENKMSDKTSEAHDENFDVIDDTQGDQHIQESIGIDEIHSKVEKNSDSNEFTNADNYEKGSKKIISNNSESDSNIRKNLEVINKDEQIHKEDAKEDTVESISNASYSQQISNQDHSSKQILESSIQNDKDEKAEKQKEQEFVITTESEKEEPTVIQSVPENDINKDDTNKVDLPELYYNRIADAVFKIKAGTITVSDAVKKITEGSSVSYDSVIKLSSMIKEKIMNQLEESKYDNTVNQKQLKNQNLESNEESNSMEELIMTEKMEQPIQSLTNSATNIQMNNEEILPKPTSKDLNVDASIGKESNDNDHIMGENDDVHKSNDRSKTNSEKQNQNISLQSNPLPSIKVNNIDRSNSGVSSSIPSSRIIPSVSCMDGISNFHEYKAKITAQRSAKLNSLSGSSNGGGSAGIKMEPIFKTLTDEIKALQSTQTIYDQYLNSVAACYQKVIIDMSLEMNRLENKQNERIEVLEKMLKALTDKESMQQTSSQHSTDSFSGLSSITLAGIATSFIKYFSFHVKPFIKTMLNFLMKQFVFYIKRGLKFLKKQEWFPHFDESPMFNNFESQLENMELDIGYLIALLVFVLMWRIILQRQKPNCKLRKKTKKQTKSKNSKRSKSLETIKMDAATENKKHQITK